MHFAQAMEQAKRGHVRKAIELAEQAADCDPHYLECRRWLARSYEELDERHHASRHLQQILHTDGEDGEAWAALERVDASAAARLRRMTEIGPDPFVARRQRSAEGLGALDDLDDGLGGDLVAEDEGGWGGGGGDDEEFEDLEQTAGEFVEEEEPLPAGDRESFETLGGEEEPEEAGTTAPAMAVEIGAPQPWEHEQDRPYREKMLADPTLGPVIQAVRESWESPDNWLSVLGTCAHASPQGHKELWEAVNAASSVLQAPELAVLIVPEGSPHSVPVRESERELAFNTGLSRCMEGAQLVFAVARTIGVLLSGATPFLHTALLATDRSITVLGECEEAIKEYVWDLAGQSFDRQPREQRQRSAALAHAWQMRCVLSCDRAGLLACGNVEAACDAIARMCCRTAMQASQTSWRSLVEKHKGEDPGALANIPVKEDPCYSEGYAFYRIQVLRWWSTTDEYKGLAGRYRAD